MVVFTIGFAVWLGADEGDRFIIVEGGVLATLLLGLGVLSWFRPLVGGTALAFVGVLGGMFVLSLLALQGPASNTLFLFLVPIAAVPLSGVLFLAAGLSPLRPVDESQRYASLRARVGAFTIDWLLWYLPYAAYAWLVGGDRFAQPFVLPLMAAQLLYFAYFESAARGASPGKMLLGIKVVDVRRQRVSFGRAFGRNVAKFVSGAILLVGYIVALRSDRRQALHDQIANTLVVRSGPPPLPPPPVLP